MLADGLSDAGLQDLSNLHLYAAGVKAGAAYWTHAVAGDTDAVLHITQGHQKWLGHSSAGPKQEHIAAAENLWRPFLSHWSSGDGNLETPPNVIRHPGSVALLYTLRSQPAAGNFSEARYSLS